jgi:hypothetical protein
VSIDEPSDAPKNSCSSPVRSPVVELPPTDPPDNSDPISSAGLRGVSGVRRLSGVRSHTG